MNTKNTLAASIVIAASAFASSAFALVPTSPLYDISHSSNLGQMTDEMEQAVVLLFGTDKAPVSTIHDTLAQPGTGSATETYLVSAD